MFWLCLWCIVRVVWLPASWYSSWRPWRRLRLLFPVTGALPLISSWKQFLCLEISSYCSVLFVCALRGELMWIPGGQIASNKEAKRCFLPIMKEIHMSITFEKCTDIMACVHNYFWPWQCAMTAFRRLLFNHIFSFSCIAFPHALLFNSLLTASICCYCNNIIWPWSTLFYLSASIPTFLLQTLFRSTLSMLSTSICYPPL